MSNKTRAAIGIGEDTSDMASLLGVSKVTPVVSAVYKNDPILKAEKEMLQSHVLEIEDDPFIQLNINPCRMIRFYRYHITKAAAPMFITDDDLVYALW